MIRSHRHSLAIGLASALSLAAGIAPVWAQQADHAAHQPPAKPAASQPPAKPVDPHAGHQPSPPARSSEDEGAMDHANMDHGAMKQGAAVMAGDDHSKMDHSKMDHGSMVHQPATSQDLPATAEPREPIPVVTPADRAAAFQPLDAHVMHGESINSYWSLDRLEAWDADERGTGMFWEAQGWVGSDLNRLWLRSEGERAGGSTESADVEVLYGRAIAPWWDAVAGIRHDFGFGGALSRTYAALGVIGLAPYKFEVKATAYLGQSGQVGLGAEAEYETLFTNRLIGQWLVEGEAWSKDDPAVGIGSGLSKVEAGFRLRYEFHRRFAPYLGVVWERAYGRTADQRRAQSGDIDDTRIVAGVRIWF